MATINLHFRWCDWSLVPRARAAVASVLDSPAIVKTGGWLHVAVHDSTPDVVPPTTDEHWKSDT